MSTGCRLIYCVKFEVIERFVLANGEQPVDHSKRSVVFRRSDVILVLPKPNVFGDVPKMLVAAAFDESELALPDLDVFWCD